MTANNLNNLTCKSVKCFDSYSGITYTPSNIKILKFSSVPISADFVFSEFKFKTAGTVDFLINSNSHTA